jgi:hypothetical protein
MKTRLLPLLATALLLAVSGCSTVKLDSTGETAAVYQFNEFRMLLNSTAPAAFAATQQAIRDYDLFETKSKLNTYDGELYARSRKDDKVFISIAEVNSKQTLLRIRWSTTGDKKQSKALYDLIEKNLGR